MRNAVNVERMIYNLVKGIQQWRDSPGVVPRPLKEEEKKKFPDVKEGVLVEGLMQIMAIGESYGTDYPNNVFDLIHFLQRPFSDWGIPEVAEMFEEDQRILHPRTKNITAFMERWYQERENWTEYEQSMMKRILLECRSTDNADAYRTIRNYLINHPVVTVMDLEDFLEPFEGSVFEHLIRHCYEDVPFHVEQNLCPHCGWSIGSVRRCLTARCQRAIDLFKEEDKPLPILENTKVKYKRLTKGIQRFITIPGLVELDVVSKIQKQWPDADVIMYPNVDQFDVEIQWQGQTVFVDVKDFEEPYHLARKLNEDLDHGRVPFRFKEKTFIVIPDDREKQRSQYIRRVRNRLAIEYPFEILLESQFYRMLKERFQHEHQSA